MKAARNQAEQAAIDAGARPGTVQITNVEEIPLSYVPGPWCGCESRPPETWRCRA